MENHANAEGINMTQDEIIEMAREADCFHIDLSGDRAKGIERLESFTKLVAAKAFQSGYEKGVAAFNEAVLIEREACAKVWEEFNFGQAAMMIQRAIRARGEA
jgi:hypothetical protein